MGKTSDGEQTFPPSQAIISKEIVLRYNGNICTPYYPALLITTNGQLWDVLVSAFRATEPVVFMMWNEMPELFKKREHKTHG